MKHRCYLKTYAVSFSLSGGSNKPKAPAEGDKTGMEADMNCTIQAIRNSRDRVCCISKHGKPATELFELTEAVTTHTAKAAFKLRRFKSYTSAITTFIHTDSFRQTEPQYHKSQSIKLPYPTGGYIFSARQLYSVLL